MEIEISTFFSSGNFINNKALCREIQVKKILWPYIFFFDAFFMSKMAINHSLIKLINMVKYEYKHIQGRKSSFFERHCKKIFLWGSQLGLTQTEQYGY